MYVQCKKMLLHCLKNSLELLNTFVNTSPQTLTIFSFEVLTSTIAVLKFLKSKQKAIDYKFKITEKKELFLIMYRRLLINGARKRRSAPFLCNA